LKSVANDGDLIVTGHHSDDQTETFLLALKRGSGLKGLSAMQKEMTLGQQLLVRPLLCFSRADIEDYAKQHQLSWIEDESNIDERFDRNFLRHQVLPVLNERWPSFNKTVARSAEHCCEAQQLLDELAQQDLVKSQISKNILDTSELLTLNQARFNNTLRYFLSKHNILMPSSQQLQQVRLQLSAESDKSPMVQLANCCLRRYKNELHLTDIFNDISSWQETVNLTEVTEIKLLALPDKLGTLTFSADKPVKDQKNYWQATLRAPEVEQVISISFVHQNPKCTPQYRQHSRSLKKVLQELAIPPWMRKRTPFIFYDGVLVAVIGQFVCKEYLANDTSEELVIVWES
jgi:tRNA(Ile)-lysidine synthase